MTVIHGAVDINPAKDAPIPKVTNSAGKAQHINVPALVNKLRLAMILFFQDDVLRSFDMMNVFYAIARIDDVFCDGFIIKALVFVKDNRYNFCV